MVCAGCKNLDTKKKKNGKSGGCVYYCKKQKKHIRASNEICDKFTKNLMINNNEYNKLYHEGLDFDDSSGSFSLYIIGAIILLIITIIIYIFNPGLYK